MMVNIDLRLGDVLEWAAAYDGPKFHSLLCDPPYELAFMGRSWDKSGVSFRPETWAALAEHLYPGAFGMAFAGTRTYHRIACAVEDAGLIIHPQVVWAFGSGFPKATRIDTQIDKAAGAEQIEIGTKRSGYGKRNGVKDSEGGIFLNSLPEELKHIPVTAPATPLAATWAGHRYGLQCLKPALEPIIVWQKPYQGRPVDCITATGAGALWVDGGRIETANIDDYGRSAARSDGTMNPGLNGYGEANRKGHIQNTNPAGRWPANLILSHLPGCNGTCADGCPVKALGEQSGESASHGGGTSEIRYWENRYGEGRRSIPKGDTGTAARFFYQVSWALDEADPVYYCAKASRKERDAGLDGMPLKTGGIKNDSGRGFSERDPYAEIKVRNPHPTVKPIDLIRYLATLLLPPVEYAPRRILIPFAGVGSECIGAALAGWEEVTGVEREAEYLEIAQARVNHWTKVQPQAQLTLELA